MNSLTQIRDQGLDSLNFNADTAHEIRPLPSFEPHAVDPVNEARSLTFAPILRRMQVYKIGQQYMHFLEVPKAPCGMTTFEISRDSGYFGSLARLRDLRQFCRDIFTVMFPAKVRLNVSNRIAMCGMKGGTQ